MGAREGGELEGGEEEGRKMGMIEHACMCGGLVQENEACRGRGGGDGQLAGQQPHTCVPPLPPRPLPPPPPPPPPRRWVPVRERSRSLSLVYSGMYTGSMLGLALSPQMIHSFGWASVFYVFGIGGLAWFAWWDRNAAAAPAEDPHISEVRVWVSGGGRRGWQGAGEVAVPHLSPSSTPLLSPPAGGAALHHYQHGAAAPARGHPLAPAAQQARDLGADRVPLLPQLGHLHPADLDAHLLQPGGRVCGGVRGAGWWGAWRIHLPRPPAYSPTCDPPTHLHPPLYSLFPPTPPHPPPTPGAGPGPEELWILLGAALGHHGAGGQRGRMDRRHPGGAGGQRHCGP